MEILKALNKQQALELFSRESIMICRDDAIPICTAARLLGEKAVSEAKERPGENWNAFYQNGFPVEYLTYTGFLRAVSYHNVEIIINENMASAAMEAGVQKVL